MRAFVSPSRRGADRVKQCIAKRAIRLTARSMRSGSSKSDPASDAMSLNHRSKTRRARTALGMSSNAERTTCAAETTSRYQQMSRVTREGSEHARTERHVSVGHGQKNRESGGEQPGFSDERRSGAERRIQSRLERRGVAVDVFRSSRLRRGLCASVEDEASEDREQRTQKQKQDACGDRQDRVRRHNGLREAHDGRE
eukprot:771637-Pleurochrysis_carterae.AAC.1